METSDPLVLSPSEDENLEDKKKNSSELLLEIQKGLTFMRDAEKSIEEFPEEMDYCKKLAVVSLIGAYAEIGNYAEVEKLMQTFPESYNKINAKGAIAIGLIKNGQLLEAKKITKDVKDLYDINFSVALGDAAETFCKNGQEEVAAALLPEISDNDVQQQRVCQDIVDSKLQKKLFQDIKEFIQNVTNEWNRVNFLNQIALAQAQAKEEDFKTTFQESIALTESFEDILQKAKMLNIIAKSQQESNDSTCKATFTKALEAARKITDDTSKVYELLDIATSLFTIGDEDYKKVFFEVKTFLQNSQNESLDFPLAEYAVKMGLFDEAETIIATFEQNLKDRIITKIGKKRAQMEKFEKADNIMERLDSSQDKFEILHEIAFAQYKKGFMSEMRETIEKIVPGGSDIFWKFHTIEAIVNDCLSEGKIDDAKKVVSLFSDPEVLKNLPKIVKAYLKNDQPQKAKKILPSLLEKKQDCFNELSAIQTKHGELQEKEKDIPPDLMRKISSMLVVDDILKEFVVYYIQKELWGEASYFLLSITDPQSAIVLLIENNMLDRIDANMAEEMFKEILNNVENMQLIDSKAVEKINKLLHHKDITTQSIVEVRIEILSIVHEQYNPIDDLESLGIKMAEEALFEDALRVYRKIKTFESKKSQEYFCSSEILKEIISKQINHGAQMIQKNIKDIEKIDPSEVLDSFQNVSGFENKEEILALMPTQHRKYIEQDMRKKISDSLEGEKKT